MNPSESIPLGSTLSPADTAALDALVDAGFDPSRVGAEHRHRAERIARLLNILTPPGTLANRDLADRVLSGLGAGDTPTHEFTLNDRDARALQSLAEAGFQASDVPAELAASAAKHAALAQLVTSAPVGVEWSPNLASRTFDLVMLMDERAPIPIEREFQRTGAGRRFWDALAVAATVLIAVSVVLPILGSVRARQVQVACSGRLGEVATAMSVYAGANQNALPAATASFGGPWWNVGKDPKSSNSANLFTLARKGYAKIRSLSCPGHENQLPESIAAGEPGSETWDWPDINHVSYSYQVMAGPNRPRWNDTASVAVLADRSPVVLRAVRGEKVYPMENSPNHQGRGQSVLFIDGSIRWMASPVLSYAQGPANRPVRVSEDNIWLPWQVEEILRQARQSGEVTLTGREVPASPFDAFLAP